MALSSSSRFVNHNGILCAAGQPLLTADSRGFRYGDGLFETMFVEGGQIRLGKYHFERLLSGMCLLDLEAFPFFAETLSREIVELCEANALSGPARVRLVVFRGESSFSGPIDHLPNYIIQAWSLPVTPGLNDHGLAIGIYPDGFKACDPLSNLKSNNYLLYILAAHYAARRGLDDCLVLNSQGRLADSTIANLFYIRNGEFFTPPLSEGMVAGVMRRYLLESLPQAGYAVHERPVTPEELLAADEIFLTNALKGVSWVRSLEERSFTNHLSGCVYEKLIKGL